MSKRLKPYQHQITAAIEAQAEARRYWWRSVGFLDAVVLALPHDRKELEEHAARNQRMAKAYYALARTIMGWD